MSLKIGLLGLEDPANVSTYSGTPYHLAHFLREAGNQVSFFGPYPVKHRKRVSYQNWLLKKLTGRHILWERYPMITDQYAGIVESYAKSDASLDLLLATSAFYLGKAKTHLPLVFWGDTTAAGVIGHYPYYKNISETMIRQCNAVEQDALDACTLAIFSNQWAADVALSSYRLDPAKVRVLCYGANLLKTPDHAEIKQFLQSRPAKQWNLLLIGVDWQRKGVDTAITTTTELRSRGFDVRLRVVGCQPPSGTSVPDGVEILGRIPKATSEGSARLAKLMSETHLFILPSRAECAAVSLAEANAFGVPVLSTNVGGNASLVKDGVNGFLLDPVAPIKLWADTAQQMLMSPFVYEEWCWRAHGYFHAELSWSVAVSRFEELIHKEIFTKKAPSSVTQDVHVHHID